MKLKQIDFRISKEDIKKLDKICAIRGVQRATMLRYNIKRLMDEEIDKMNNKSDDI